MQMLVFYFENRIHGNRESGVHLEIVIYVALSTLNGGSWSWLSTVS